MLEPSARRLPPPPVPRDVLPLLRPLRSVPPPPRPLRKASPSTNFLNGNETKKPSPKAGVPEVQLNKPPANLSSPSDSQLSAFAHASSAPPSCRNDDLSASNARLSSTPSSSNYHTTSASPRPSSSFSSQSNSQLTNSTPPSTQIPAIQVKPQEQGSYRPRKRPTQSGIIRKNCSLETEDQAIPCAIRHMTCAAAVNLVGRPNATIAQALHRLSLLDSVPRRRGRPRRAEIEERNRVDQLRAELYQQVHQLRAKHNPSTSRVGLSAQTPTTAMKPPSTTDSTAALGTKSKGGTNYGIKFTRCKYGNNVPKHECTIPKSGGATKPGAQSEHAVACKRQSNGNVTMTGTKRKRLVSMGRGYEGGRGVKRKADSTGVEQDGGTCKSPKRTVNQADRKEVEIGKVDKGESEINEKCGEKVDILNKIDGTKTDEKQALIESLQRELSEVRETLQKESKRADELEEALNVEVQVHASKTVEEKMLREKIRELEQEVERYERNVCEGEDEMREKNAALKGLMTQVKELEGRRCEGCGGRGTKTWREDDSDGGENTTREEVDGLRKYVEAVNARLKRVLQRNRRMQQKLYELVGRQGSLGVDEVT